MKRGAFALLLLAAFLPAASLGMALKPSMEFFSHNRRAALCFLS